MTKEIQRHSRRGAAAWVALCSLLVLLTVSAYAAEAPATGLSPALEAADEKLASVKSLRARFEQEKTIALLKRPLISKGTVSMQDGRVLWNTESPRSTAMLVEAGEIRMFDVDAKRVEVYRVEERFSDMAASPVPRLDLLAQSFDIETTEDPGALVLRLSPRTDLLRDQLDEATLTLDTARGFVREIEIVDQDGDRTRIRFLDVEINVDLDPAATTLNVPPDTEIVMPQGGSR